MIVQLTHLDLIALINAMTNILQLIVLLTFWSSWHYHMRKDRQVLRKKTFDDIKDSAHE